MMSSEVPRIYFDSCCFIDLATTALGYPIDKDGRDAHVWYCRAFLDAARGKDVEVSTSTVAVVECTAVKDALNRKIMTEEVKRLFKGMLLSGKPVLPIQPTPRILDFARDLRWVHGLNVKPMDAVHIASAIDRGCSIFVTTDKPLTALKKELQEFGLMVCKADALFDQLPDKYRQLSLEKKGFLPKRKLPVGEITAPSQD